MKKRLLIISFIFYLIGFVIIGCDSGSNDNPNDGNKVEHTINFNILGGKIYVEPQKVLTKDKVSEPLISEGDLPPYAKIIGYMSNEVIWNFKDGVRTNMTLVAVIEWDFNKIFDVVETKSSFTINGVKPNFNDKYLYIPSEVGNLKTTISSTAFVGCEVLEKIEFEAGVSIYGGAFNGAVNLKEVILPSDMKVIKANTFNNCGKLDKVVFPKDLITIEQGAFANTGFTRLEVDVVTIEKEAFKGCNLLEEVTLNNIKNISISAFEGLIALTKVTISSDEDVEVGERAFANCNNLTKINLEKVTKIANEAFINTNSLNNMNLINIKDIGRRAFYIDRSILLKGVCEIKFKDYRMQTLQSVGEQAFYNRINWNGELTFNIDTFTNCGNYAFGNTGITSIILYKTQDPLNPPEAFANYWNGEVEGNTEHMIQTQIKKIVLE